MWRTLIEEGRYTVIHDYSVEARDHTSIGGIIIPDLENQEYVIFMHDVNTAVNNGAIIMSIFTDISGTIYAKDSNDVDINLRTVKSTSYTYPYYDNNNVFTNGIITVLFEDGATFQNIDNLPMEDDPIYGYWYYIQGVSDMNNLHKFT